MEAPKESLSVRTSYNLQGFSFTPEEVYASIKKYMPNFEIHYKPDHRQKIAENWPQAIDDSKARADWGWKPGYNLDEMSMDMLENLKKQKS
jgi:nucleoside-diphosphate-sugar epimerase